MVCECDRGNTQNKYFECEIYSCRPRSCYADVSKLKLKTCYNMYNLLRETKDEVLYGNIQIKMIAVKN